MNIGSLNFPYGSLSATFFFYFVLLSGRIGEIALRSV